MHFASKLCRRSKPPTDHQPFLKLLPPSSQHLAAPHIAFLRTLHNSIASGVSKSATAADATVHALLSSNRVRIAVAAYWVYSLCWVFCKRLAGIYATC